MIVLFNHGVTRSLLVPRIRAKLGFRIDASFIEMEQAGLQHCSSIANTVEHVVLRVLDAEFAVPPDCFLEGGGRRVNDDLLNQVAVCEGLKIGIILFIGLLLALLAAVVLILFHHEG